VKKRNRAPYFSFFFPSLRSANNSKVSVFSHVSILLFTLRPGSVRAKTPPPFISRIHLLWGYFSFPSQMTSTFLFLLQPSCYSQGRPIFARSPFFFYSHPFAEVNNPMQEKVISLFLCCLRESLFLRDYFGSILLLFSLYPKIPVAVPRREVDFFFPLCQIY